MKVKLKTLAPRVAKLDTSIARTLSMDDQTPRLRGRGLMERNERFLRHNPLCRICEARGLVEPAVECDHVIPLWKGGADDESNLQGLCDKHHKAKTAAEAKERASGMFETVTNQPADFDVGFA